MATLFKKQKKKTAIAVACMGAPTYIQGLTTPEFIVKAVRRFEEIKKQKVDYILPVEIGPVNSALALLTAAKLGIPVVDADGAGRAVPTLNLLTYSVQHNISINPTVLTGKDTRHVVLNISDDRPDVAASMMEALTRPVVSLPGFDGMAGLAFWFVEDVSTLEENWCVPGTLTLSRDLGVQIEKVQKSREYLPEYADAELIRFLEGNESPYPFIKLLGKGTLKEVFVNSSEGFDLGMICIEKGREFLTILFQNESLLLWDSGQAQPLAMAPDLITYLIIPKDYKPGNLLQWVYTNADIMNDHGNSLKEELLDANITVIGLQAPKQLRQQEKAGAEHDRPDRDIEKENPVPGYFMNILNKLNYYGAYLPLEKTVTGHQP